MGEESSITTKLKKVTYQRTYQSAHSLPICLVGESRLFRDIELLLEDDWKNLFCPATTQDLSGIITDRVPSLYIIEMGAFGGQEIRLIDSVIPKSSQRMVVSPESRDELGWVRLKRHCCSQGIVSLEISDSPQEAAKALSEVLEGMTSVGLLNNNEDFRLIQNAYQGFSVHPGTESLIGIADVFKFLASRFVMDEIELQSAIILTEFYDLWIRLKTVNELFIAFKRIENNLRGKTAMTLIKLAEKLVRQYREGNQITNEEWSDLLSKSELGMMAKRDLSSQFKELILTLEERQVAIKNAA